MISNSHKKIHFSPNLILLSILLAWPSCGSHGSAQFNLILFCPLCLFSYQLLLFKFWFGVDPGSRQRMKPYENCTAPGDHTCWRTPGCDGSLLQAPRNCLMTQILLQDSQWETSPRKRSPGLGPGQQDGQTPLPLPFSDCETWAACSLELISSLGKWEGQALWSPRWPLPRTQDSQNQQCLVTSKKWESTKDPTSFCSFVPQGLHSTTGKKPNPSSLLLAHSCLYLTCPMLTIPALIQEHSKLTRSCPPEAASLLHLHRPSMSPLRSGPGPL